MSLLRIVSRSGHNCLLPTSPPFCNVTADPISKRRSLISHPLNLGWQDDFIWPIKPQRWPHASSYSMPKDAFLFSLSLSLSRNLWPPWEQGWGNMLDGKSPCEASHSCWGHVDQLADHPPIGQLPSEQAQPIWKNGPAKPSSNGCSTEL